MQLQDILMTEMNKKSYKCICYIALILRETCIDMHMRGAFLYTIIFELGATRNIT